MFKLYTCILMFSYLRLQLKARFKIKAAQAQKVSNMLPEIPQGTVCPRSSGSILYS